MFWVLTLLTILCVIYCSDSPVVCEAFSFFINDHNSMWYGIGLSVIAAYIFFIIQTWIPQKKHEKRAYVILKKQIEQYIECSYWILVFCEELCCIDRENKKITIISPYANWSKNGKTADSIVKIDISSYEEGLKKLKNSISGNNYYMQLEENKRRAIQALIDNKFVLGFKRHLAIADKLVDEDLIQEYDEFKLAVSEAKKRFGMKDIILLQEYSNEDRIKEFEVKISAVKLITDNMDMTGIWFMGI